MKWVYSAVVLVLAAIVFAVFLWAVATFLAPQPVAPAPTHQQIHSGIGNALCTPSYVCSQEF